VLRAIPELPGSPDGEGEAESAGPCTVHFFRFSLPDFHYQDRTMRNGCIQYMKI
jgi:hypothetical protein